ncbi:type II toxin-antitoxin system RelE/ParE family toxin [Pseudomonas sp. B11(2017)]|uniref:type II toxin-antitoxin system RelE/ParE family toxin n=1 Tax=Pseudomonas sp. B11(2017) TaxID=1981748 RepID=UPI000A1E42BF|nr:type II toxin-antitoxin system RelE/ParE family toxin [Pseudomonas sp. B11(2017)]
MASKPIEWRPEARAKLVRILEYITERHRGAAIELTRAIGSAASKLPDHPHLYRPCRITGTREIVVHPSYLIVYRVTDRIEILNVLHARQEYPRRHTL